MDASGSQPGHQNTGRQVRGRSLHDVLHDPGTGIAQQAVIPLDPSRVVLIARAILKALASGAVHGYINPYTILLTDDGNALLVGDRVAPGATPANDLFALGMALFEAVEGYAPHPAEPLPAMSKAGVLAPLIGALTARDPGQRPDAAAALGLLDEGLAASAASATSAAPASPDVTETRTLPQVPETTGSGDGGPGGDSGDSAETSLLPRIPAMPVAASEPPGPPEPPDYSAGGYAAYDDHPEAKRRAMLIGGAFAGVVVITGVALGATQPWHKTDNSSSTVPGVPTAISVATAPVAATPSASAPGTPSSTADTPTPTPPPTVSNPTTLMSMSLCLDAASGAGGVKSGAKVSAGTCHGSPNQAWQIHTDGTIHSMADANLCLDAAAPDGKVANAAQVSAWTCHGGPNQDWVWNANGTVSPAANTGLCLDAAGPVPIHSGANVTAWPCNAGPNEKWAKQ